MPLSSSHFAIASDQADAFWFLGNLAEVKAAGHQTGGALAVVEFAAPPGFATPRHVHQAEDEAFYVLEGSIAGFWARADRRRPPDRSFGCRKTNRMVSPIRRTA